MKRTSTETNVCPICGYTKLEPTRCGGCDWTTPPITALQPVRTVIRRPSRFQQTKAGDELTVSGLAMSRAIETVRKTVEEHNAIGVDAQEGALISLDRWDVTHRRYEQALKKLADCRAKISAGLTYGQRTC